MLRWIFYGARDQLGGFARFTLLQILRRLCNLRQVISIELLHDFAQAFMTIVLLIPHILFYVSKHPVSNKKDVHKMRQL